MNRRDFLLFKKAGGHRVAELSCERLYMRAVDTALVSAGNGSANEAWDGEPPAVFDARTIEQLFADIERELRDIDLVRVIDDSWLASSGLRQRLDIVLGSVRARGGLVETS